MKWSQIAAREPALGAVLHDRLIRPGVVLLGTTRRTGRHGQRGGAADHGRRAVAIDDAHVRKGQPTSAGIRGSCCTASSPAPKPAAEVKVRGTVRPEPDLAVQQTYAGEAARQLGWRPLVGEFALFAVDVGDVTVIGYDAESGAQYVARWPEGREFLRPSTTPTSLGPPEPVHRLLSPAMR